MCAVLYVVYCKCIEEDTVGTVLFFTTVCTNLFVFTYSRSSRKRPPREFEKVVVTRAGHLQEYALVSDPW